ncbi:GNVR domain-containing protein [Tenacibaculum sp. nBUS_03]|uniref:GNVR domain-containing protein n=1 Tax=Tenacibaculum sp. nBUS_03 TaxID=3395320 RepID=UPI003EBB79B1
MTENKCVNNPEDEINLLELFKIILKGKKTIIRFVFTFGLIGFLIAIFSEKEYTSSTIIVPQTTTSKVGGNIGGLAAMAGINLGGGNTNENIPPSLYPKIVHSLPFLKELSSTPLRFSNFKKEITYKEYYQKHKKRNILSYVKNYTIGLPSKLIGFFSSKEEISENVRKDSIYRISIDESIIFKQIKDQVTLEINKDGFIKISFSMFEALASAQMTKKLQELLQKTIINFKTQKAKSEYKFIEERHNELKKDFEKKQVILANFRDRNQGLITSRSQTRLESLESEYNLAYTIYSELAKQLETQKIKLKENTPVFRIIDPVSVPVLKSKPKRTLIIVIWIFLGVVLGIGWVFGKEWVNKLKVIIKLI